MVISYLLLLDRRWLDRFTAPPTLVESIDLRRRDVLTAALVIPALALAVWWNLATFTVHGRRVVDFPPALLNSTVQATGIWQAWNLFSPEPLHRDGWITAVGRFEDGRVIDLMTQKPETAQMRRYFVGPELRRKKYENYLLEAGTGGPLLFQLAASLCRRENARQPPGRRLATVRIRWWYRQTPSWGEQPEPYAPETIWRHWCYPQYRNQA
jgi:hypothetical protein